MTTMAKLQKRRKSSRLSDALRAAVFGRDKAICAFSGLSLWVLDYGMSGLYHSDWPDHIKPASRGGRDTLGNLVCASFFYNGKKGNNGSDASYLFIDGAPTSIYFWNFPRLSPEHVNMLRSHAAITATDWYFNRALANILIALWDDYDKTTPARNRDYWLSSAEKRLSRWTKLGGKNDFQRRRLLLYPRAPDIRLMLELTKCPTYTSLDDHILEVYAKLRPYFFANTRAIDNFIKAKTDVGRREVVRRAMLNRHVTSPVRDILQSHLSQLAWHTGPTSIHLDRSILDQRRRAVGTADSAL